MWRTRGWLWWRRSMSSRARVWSWQLPSFPSRGSQTCRLLRFKKRSRYVEHNSNYLSSGLLYFSVAAKCVVDTPLRHLTHYVDLGEDVTPESCIEACTTLAKPGPGPKIPGYVFAGVQAGSQCFCGNANISSTWEAPASECDMPCSGNSKQICGGSMRMNVFETGIPWFTGE